jgi:hypothetical protein
MLKVFIVTVSLVSFATPGLAQFQDLMKGFGIDKKAGKAAGKAAKATSSASGLSAAQSALGDVKIGEGLKEALKVGTGNAVAQTGTEGGYLDNEKIKILMPDQLQTLDKGLRMIGYGPQIDEFVLSMNRAAEKAAPAAKEIFLDAIGEMTIDDSRKILAGSDTAATEYFQEKTSDKLAAAFKPTVSSSMNDVGVTKKYKDLVGKYQSVPFASQINLDIDDYVTGKAVDGLFVVVGEQEKKIRTVPTARVNDLLKEVFNK